MTTPDCRETIWLASYPRSGNTLLRIILRDVFSARSESKYKSGTSDSSWPKAARLSLKNDALDLSKPRLVKTHDLPSDNSKAVYVVRDGRSALASYFHYLHDIAGTPKAIEDVISGNVWPGSWSDHVAAWSSSKHERVLLIRYEDLCLNLDSIIPVLGNFLNLEAVAAVDVADIFRRMNAVYPKFFRVGNNLAGIEQIRPHANLFNNYHARCMFNLGYFANDKDFNRWNGRGSLGLI